MVYRVLAYHRAASSIREATESAMVLSEEGRLTELRDVGETIAAKVTELRTTGTIAALERLQAKVPPGLVDIMHLPGIGAKTTRKLAEALGITTLDELREAAEARRVRAVPGLGAKAEEKLLSAIAAGAQTRKGVVLLDRGLARAETMLEELRAHPACTAASEAGSLRRRRETIGDVDLIAASDDPRSLLEAFAASGAVAEVIARGETKCSVMGHDGLQVDLRVVPPASYGNLLQHFTGSKEHNVQMREDAAARGLRVSEWGIEEVGTGEVFRTSNEDDVYRHLGYEPVPPELREGRGELSLARAGTLPRLVELAEIRADLHTHTTASDGKASITEMAAAARARGYGYYAVTDHSKAVGMGIGLDAEQMLEHAAAIRDHAASLRRDGFHLLAGAEVDILVDGRLDYPDDVLAGLDWVVASVHGQQGLDRERRTARVCAAAAHPHVDVIGHPTGRQLGRREPFELDLERVIATCLDHGTFLEVNANPRRLDLRGSHVRTAIDAGVRIVISTDAHQTATLDYMQHGVSTARRGWATAADIVNTRDWDGFRALRKAGRPCAAAA